MANLAEYHSVIQGSHNEILTKPDCIKMHRIKQEVCMMQGGWLGDSDGINIISTMLLTQVLIRCMDDAICTLSFPILVMEIQAVGRTQKQGIILNRGTLPRVTPSVQLYEQHNHKGGK